MTERKELRRPRFKVLIALDDPVQRARICGYPPDWDCLHDLTLDHLRRFADSGWLRKWGTDPALREHTQASITIYGDSQEKCGST